MSVLEYRGETFDAAVPVAVIGAGACGMVAALAASDSGSAVALLERDAMPAGTTALSSGMIPACGTRIQRTAGVLDDSTELMARDIRRKADPEAPSRLVEVLCRESGPTIDWLVERHGIELCLVAGPPYPGHSRSRTHAPPSHRGADLVAMLRRAVENAGIDLVTSATVTGLFADGDARIHGLQIERPDSKIEYLGCKALILASSGFGGEPEMIGRHIPDMAGAIHLGHAGNRGDAVRWGLALGAAVRNMDAYQGHGAVAVPQSVAVSWMLVNQGGFLVNQQGRRFANEHGGSSGLAAEVLRQPDRVSWVIFDQRLHHLARDNEDYRAVETLGAIRTAASAEALADRCRIPAEILSATLAEAGRLARGNGTDRFGRDFTTALALAPPYHAIRVTGGLLHTQGGLAVNSHARVERPDGSPLPNLFAGGGAAAGVSGSGGAGYLSGNGLLSAVALGRIAGRQAAALRFDSA